MPQFNGVSHIDLTVRDADKSAAWYQRVLCMQLLGDLSDLATPGVAARVVQVRNPATGMTLGLMQHEAVEEGDFSEFRIGLDHLALAVESRADLERWIEHLESCDVPHSEIADMPYGSLFVFRDPDNIQLEFFALSPEFKLDLG